MLSSDRNLPPTLPLPSTVRAVVCCDLDETYIPFSREKKPLGGVAELEAFMAAEGAARGILLGWITGTNRNSALRKADGYISRSPHFLCCSLGTEFYWIRNGELSASVSWKERMSLSGYHAENIEKIVKHVSSRGIPLERQPEDYQGPYKKSFYYRTRRKVVADFDWIESLATKFQVRVLFTRCNPAAGDPGDCFDVDFIPLCCGKDQAVSFLMEEINVPKESIFAFGDSENDFSMFARAGQAYLVANADRAAIKKHGSCLPKPYCHGILSVIKDIPS